ARKNQKQIQIKEIKFRPGTEEGDYKVKLRNLIKFLSEGDKAKVSLRFRGREMAHQELGMELLKRVEADLAEYGTVEQHPKMEGRQLMKVPAAKKAKQSPELRDSLRLSLPVYLEYKIMAKMMTKGRASKRFRVTVSGIE